MFVMNSHKTILFVRGSQMKWQPANEAAQSWSQDPDFSGWLENIGENQNPAVWQNPRTQARYTTEVQTLKIAEETATLLVLTPEVPSFFTMLEDVYKRQALFLFDLDNLKKVNDQLGHDCGDQRIRQFSRLLRSHFRQSDIFARLGQDEFIVVMKKTARKEAVVRKGEALGQAFVEAGWNQDVPLTVSAGIAMWDLSETLDEVLSRACLLYTSRCV